MIALREHIKYLSKNLLREHMMKHLCSWRNIRSPPSSNLLQLQGGHPGKDSQNLFKSDFELFYLAIGVII